MILDYPNVLNEGFMLPAYPLLVILLLCCTTPMATEIHMPALLAICGDLNVSLDAGQKTVMVFLVMAAFTQFLSGPYVDRVGPLKPLWASLGLMILGSLLCMSAETFEGFLLGRCFQGLGGGVLAVIWRALFAQMLTPESMTRIGGYFGTLVMVMLPLSLVVGAYLTHWGSWRWCFGFLALYAWVCALLSYPLLKKKRREGEVHVPSVALMPPLTCPPPQEVRPKGGQRSWRPSSWGGFLKGYRLLLGHRPFWEPTLAVFWSCGSFYAWMVVLPVVLLKGMGLTPVLFSWLHFVGLVFSFVLGSYLNDRWVGRRGAMVMACWGWGLMVLGNVVLFWVPIVAQGPESGYGLLGVVMLCFVLFYLGGAWVWPNLFALAFSQTQGLAGSASALYGGVQIASGALASGVMVLCSEHNTHALSVWSVMCVLASVCTMRRHLPGRG